MIAAVDDDMRAVTLLPPATRAAAATIDRRAIFLPADRATRWQPGMMGAGGIPARSTICATLNSGRRRD